MNIICVIDSLGSGGAQRQLVELAIGLKKRGNSVSFITYFNDPFYALTLEKAGISITCIEEPGYLKRIFRMRFLIRNGKYDAVISFLDGPNFISELAGIPFRKWKLIVGERIADPEISRSLRLRIYRLFHIFATFVVSNSHTNIELVRRTNPFIRKSKLKVIFNSLDTSYWKPDNNFIFRKEAKIKLVIAASHCYRKNLSGLIEALSLLKKDEQKLLNIEWYGARLSEPYFDNSFPEGLMNLKEMNNTHLIRFFPSTQKIADIVKQADTIALFSLNEGLPNIICEGMACGKPVLCPAVSDMPEILKHQSELIFDPTKPDSIAQSIKNLLGMTSSQFQAIGDENREIALREFTKEKILNSYIKVLTG